MVSSVVYVDNSDVTVVLVVVSVEMLDEVVEGIVGPADVNVVSVDVTVVSKVDTVAEVVARVVSVVADDVAGKAAVSVTVVVETGIFDVV